MMSNFLHDDASSFEQAQYELRRVDHLIYVSLKYTRTVDVIKNIISRLISTLDFVWEDFLKKAEKSRKIFEIPTSPGARINVVKKLYGDDEKLMDAIEFYMLLRQFNNAEYTSEREFRRHVAMKALFPNGEVKELNIDIITEYYQQVKKILEYIGHTYYNE